MKPIMMPFFYPGGHGPLWDLATDKTSSALIEVYTNNKPVAFVCHSPAVLKNVKVNGEFLVKGKNVTGFSNTEELPLTDVVPFLLKMLYKLTEQAIQKWKTGILMQLKTVC
jgi:putative intracellular protease/amidase